MSDSAVRECQEQVSGKNDIHHIKKKHLCLERLKYYILCGKKFVPGTGKNNIYCMKNYSYVRVCVERVKIIYINM